MLSLKRLLSLVKGKPKEPPKTKDAGEDVTNDCINTLNGVNPSSGSKSYTNLKRRTIDTKDSDSDSDSDYGDRALKARYDRYASDSDSDSKPILNTEHKKNMRSVSKSPTQTRCRQLCQYRKRTGAIDDEDSLDESDSDSDSEPLSSFAFSDDDSDENSEQPLFGRLIVSLNRNVSSEYVRESMRYHTPKAKMLPVGTHMVRVHDPKNIKTNHFILQNLSFKKGGMRSSVIRMTTCSKTGDYFIILTDNGSLYKINKL